MSGAINGRPGRLPAFCAAAPQHPSTSVLSALPRDLLRGAPWGEVQRDRPRGSCYFCAGAYGARSAAASAAGAYCCTVVQSLALLPLCELRSCWRRATRPVPPSAAAALLLPPQKNGASVCRRTRFCSLSLQSTVSEGVAHCSRRLPRRFGRRRGYATVERLAPPPINRRRAVSLTGKRCCPTDAVDASPASRHRRRD